MEKQKWKLQVIGSLEKTIRTAILRKLTRKIRNYTKYNFYVDNFCNFFQTQNLLLFRPVGS